MKTFALIESELKMLRIPEEDQWQEVSSELVQMQRSINWWLGDLIVYGEAQIGDEIYQYFPEDVSVSHLDRCAHVSRSYPSGERNPRVSWSHHYLASGLPISMRRAALYRAEMDMLNTSQFKTYLSELKGIL